MPKEACRLLTSTVTIIGILCMAEGLPSRKESEIDKAIYYNKDLNNKGEFDRDNEQVYEKEYFRQKKFASQNENGFGYNLQNVNEKSGNINPINNEYEIRIIKKRMSSQDKLRPGKKNPLSYLHINHDTKNKQPDIYIIDANDFNKDVIQRFTRTEKKYELPMCDIDENQENMPPSNSLNLQKRGLSNTNKDPISKMIFNHELQRKIRSQWKFRDHYSDFEMKNNKYKSPIEYNEKNKGLNTDQDKEKAFFHEINNQIDKNEKFKRETMDEKGLMSSIEDKKPDSESKTDEKQNELFNKPASNKLMAINTKRDNEDSIIPNESINTKNNLPSTGNNISDQIKMIQNQDLTDKEKLELAIKTRLEHPENEAVNLSNLTNNDFEHSEKNKIKLTNVQGPSIAPLTLPSGVVPNISYVYLQPLPLGSSMFLNEQKPYETSSAPSKKSDHASNPETKSNDLITISIDPKTLQNKILHAEFLKKSDVKKTPDTLTIELSPKDTNSSKHQSKAVQKPLKIAASVKNNSIFITGGEIKNYQANISNEKKNLQIQALKENFNKADIEKDPLYRPMKSISPTINMNDILDDNKSLRGYNLQNEMNYSDKDNNDETKVLIINAKQKEVCATEEPCKQMSTYCSINLCDEDTHCKRSTWNLQNFKEVHEIGTTEEKPTSVSSTTGNISENKTGSTSTTDEAMISTTDTDEKVKTKRETGQVNISKIMDILKPVLVIGPKVDNEGSEDESADTAGLIEKVNLKGASEMAFEKGNKKVENKILEGFINSIIANYSKDEIKPMAKETTEKSEDGAEALLKLLESNMPKRNERDKGVSDEKKTDIWSLTPILVPESSISNYGDSSEYTKLGPFDENFIKSFLKKDCISSLYRKKK